MEIVRCDESYLVPWNEFVETSASFYHRFEWQQITRAEFGHETSYLAAVDRDRIHGILPVVRLRSRMFGTIGCSLPFVNYGGPVATSPQVEHALMEHMTSLAEDWRLDYLEIRSRHPVAASLPTSAHKVSMTIALDPDPDVLWQRFKTGHRQDIRRAYKNGLTARVGGKELLDDFYGVVSESWRDMGTPFYRKSYLERIVRTFADAVRICVVYAGTDPAAAAFDGLHGETVEGMWLGIRSKHRSLGVGYALYWELIKSACEAGYRLFHLGRSTVQSGGEMFKKKWNAEPSQLYWQYVLRTRKEMPQLNVQNSRYRLAINAWRRLPLPVTQIVGPFIARSIP